MHMPSPPIKMALRYLSLAIVLGFIASAVIAQQPSINMEGRGELLMAHNRFRRAVNPPATNMLTMVSVIHGVCTHIIAQGYYISIIILASFVASVFIPPQQQKPSAQK